MGLGGGRLYEAAIGQVGLIVEAVLANRECGMALKEQAVLFRTSHHSAMLEIELTRRNIPFIKFGGLKFTEAAHVKDMLAVLRWAENPTDRVTGFRVAQLLPGLGPATAAKVEPVVSTSSTRTTSPPLPISARTGGTRPGRTRKASGAVSARCSRSR